MTPLEFRRNLWQQKTRIPGLSVGYTALFGVILSLAVLVQYRRMTDGRTDKHTDTRRQHHTALVTEMPETSSLMRVVY